MHAPDNSSDSGYYTMSNNQYGTNGGKRYRGPPTVTDMPLDDNFDAATVTRDSEIYRMWEDEEGSAYDAVEFARQKNSFKNVYHGDVRARRNSESLLVNTKKEIPQIGAGRRLPTQGIESDRGGGRRSGRTEMVETRILEDSPQRTISVWREQVATSSQTDNVTRSELDVQSSRRLGGHRRTVSGNMSQSSGSVVSRESRAKDVVKTTRRSLERSIPNSPLRTVEDSSTIQFPLPSPLQYDKGRASPFRTASPRPLIVNSPAPRNVSPSASRSGSLRATNLTTKSNSTSTLELMLSSCRPPLLHLTPVLEEIGIRKEEHLRAVAKMNEETRDREVREEALKRGVTVLEWAIFLDKLQGLYSYDDMYL